MWEIWPLLNFKIDAWLKIKYIPISNAVIYEWSPYISYILKWNIFLSWKASELPKRTKLDEVKWRDSSAKKITDNFMASIKIRCEMVVPLGSTIIWSKDGKVLRKNKHPNIANVQVQVCLSTIYLIFVSRIFMWADS